MSAAPAAQPLDFDLHGVVGVRLIGAREDDARVVRAQLGGVVRPLGREPDITVRFRTRLDLTGLTYLEPGRSGYTAEGYFLLSHRRRPVRARLGFGDAARGIEIECEHGTAAVPMLDEWIRLVALARGHVPLHASAFERGGVGVLVVGGPHGGKTSCLLAFAGTGARFVSDDLVLLSGDGDAMLGVPGELSVSHWQLDQLPGFGRRLGRARRSLLAAAHALERLQPRAGHGALAALTHTLPPALRRRLGVSLRPEELFDTGPTNAATGAIFLALSHAAPEVSVRPLDADRLARRLAVALRLELEPLIQQYLGYRFAFPERSSALLEGFESDAERLLRRALAGRRVFELRHPHPASLEELRRAMEPFIAAPPRHVATNSGSAAAAPLATPTPVRA